MGQSETYVFKERVGADCKAIASGGAFEVADYFLSMVNGHIAFMIEIFISTYYLTITMIRAYFIIIINSFLNY